MVNQKKIYSNILYKINKKNKGENITVLQLNFSIYMEMSGYVYYLL